MNTLNANLYEAWMQKEHASLFGGWDGYSTKRLVRLCDQFNECQLARTLVGVQHCRTVSDVGCATGRFYRFFREVFPTLEYRGFDISEAAIGHAKKLFLAGDFRVFDGNVKSLADISADIVFCRDVMHHQVKPVEFLSNLYDITGGYLILRVRTREVGDTVFDVTQSCQYTYGRWVPYIVFNTAELIELISSLRPAPVKITLRRHPEVLGGQNSRFLPKELYYPETGTAETAVLIEKGAREVKGDVTVSVETRPELQNQKPASRLLRKLARRWGL